MIILKKIADMLRIVRLEGRISDVLEITCAGIPDGTRIAVSCFGEPRRQFGSFKAGRALLNGAFYTDGEYEISVKDSDGTVMNEYFAVKDGVLGAVVRSLDVEKERLWRAVVFLAGELEKIKENTDRLVVGYPTE